MLTKAAALLSDDVWVIAPTDNRSGFAHGITIGRSFSIEQIEARRFACTGTPADCVIAGLNWVFRDQKRPDLVLSGINAGRNVAEDVSYSGTMAVAREAALCGIAGIAFSTPRDSNALDAQATGWLAERIGDFWEARDEWARDGHWLSINLPRQLPAEMRAARIGRDKVAKTVLIHAETDKSAVIEPLAKRSYLSTPGDENHLVDSGIASVVCFNWMGSAEVPSRALRDLASEVA
jgi:5'-nucleotidase